MGYRELLKKYIRYLELYAGDNYIESAPAVQERILSQRDLGELRTIAAEIYREAHADPASTTVANHNYRFRLLLNRYGIGVTTAAEIAGVDVDTIRRWRTQPRSRRYLKMTEAEYAAFDAALARHLDRGSRAAGDRAPLR